MTFPPHATTRSTSELPHQLTGVAVFLLTAVSLAIPSGYSIGAVILLFAGMGLILTRRVPVLSKQDGWVIATLVAYALVSMLEAWWDGQAAEGSISQAASFWPFLPCCGYCAIRPSSSMYGAA